MADCVDRLRSPPLDLRSLNLPIGSYRRFCWSPNSLERDKATQGFYERSSCFHGFHQGGDLDRCKVGKGVRDSIRKDDLVLVSHRSTGIDDIRNVSFALGRIGTEQRLVQTSEYLRRILFIE